MQSPYIHDALEHLTSKCFIHYSVIQRHRPFQTLFVVFLSFFHLTTPLNCISIYQRFLLFELYAYF